MAFVKKLLVSILFIMKYLIGKNFINGQFIAAGNLDKLKVYDYVSSILVEIPVMTKARRFSVTRKRNAHDFNCY